MADMPPDIGREVAFAGRSNIGKSSAINRIAGRRNLARVSARPGRTRLINFFAFDEDAARRFVDLPGYGYARVPRSVAENWRRLIEKYLADRRSLSALVLLADARHGLRPADESLLDWAGASEMPLLVLLGKADKLGRAALVRRLEETREYLGHRAEVFAFSASSGLGADRARSWLARRLGASVS